VKNKMKSIILLLACVGLVGCKLPSRKENARKACDVEFDYYTNRNGKDVVCRMVWCQLGRGGAGGAVVLWCE
jgi:hypothetical protein